MNLRKAYLSLIEEVWTIGIVESSLKDIINGEDLKIHSIKHSYHDRWFADPFVLDVIENQIELLVEEYYFPIRRGRIAKLTIDRKSYRLLNVVTVLELDTHLSFPAIIRKEGALYIYPENSASGKLTLYSYNPQTNKCIPESILVEEPLTDAIIYSPESVAPLLFSTKVPTMQHHLLGVYIKEGNCFVFSKNYVFKDRITRGAGDFFCIDNKLYRPAQEYNKWYGRGLSIQKVELNNGECIFTEIRRIHSNVKGYKDGIHTLNSYKNVIVVDLKHYKHPYLRPFAQFIMSCYIWIKSIM